MKLQNKTTSNRLGGYLTAAVTVGTLARTASAAIVTFSNSGSFIEGTVDDGDQPTISITLPDTSLLKIDSEPGSNFLDLSFSNMGYLARFTGSGTLTSGFYTYPSVSLLNLGDTIFANNAGDFPSFASIVNNGTPQNDFVGDVSGFIGFITPLGNKGWLDVAFNSTTGLFQYNGGAVATAGEDLLAGAVPEPSTAVLSLGALAAGAFIRRRKQMA